MAYTDYSQAFQGAEQKYGLPAGTLGGIGYVESRYNPQAVSPKGAQGMMQFMPATAKSMGLSNPFDPNAAIDAAGNLMSQNMKATHGNLANALMMYNAGTNPDKWQPSYADQVQARMQPPQPGGQPQMPPQTAPMSLADLQSTTPMQSQAPSLGAMVQSIPQGNIPKPSKFTAGNILGTLGDALSAYGGRQPTFGPFLRDQQMMDKQQGFEREKFQQELAMRMYAMTHPQDMMDGIAFANAPKEVQQAMVYRENALHPTVAGVQQPNGSVINTVIPRQLPPQVGEVQDGHKFLGGDPANPQSWEAVQ